MILDYIITDSIISSIVAISEKIGQLKEIRQANKHIDFDQACLIKNIQNTFKEKDITCPDRVIAALLESDAMVQPSDMNENIEVLKVISLYKNIIKTKYLGFDSFIKMYDESKIFQESIQDLGGIAERQNSSNHFFLYHAAVFCYDCFYKTNGDLEELWVTSLFYREYGMFLYFPYDSFFKQEQYIGNENGTNHFSLAESRAKREDAIYPLYEFFLDVINQVLEHSINFHHELLHPNKNRVKRLKGVIREPFSRKEYMRYYKISSATASLDLKKAVKNKTLVVKGDKIKAVYWFSEGTMNLT